MCRRHIFMRNQLKITETKISACLCGQFVSCATREVLEKTPKRTNRAAFSTDLSTMYFLIIYEGCFTFNDRIADTLHLALRFFPNSNCNCIVLRCAVLKTIKHIRMYLSISICVLLSLERYILKRCNCNSNSGKNRKAK